MCGVIVLWMQAGVGLLVTDVMPIYMIIALDIVMLNSNLFTHLMLSFKREASSENYAPQVYLLAYYFQIYKIKNSIIP